jgi:hypothetical protein
VLDNKPHAGALRTTRVGTDNAESQRGTSIHHYVDIYTSIHHHNRKDIPQALPVSNINQLDLLYY